MTNDVLNNYGRLLDTDPARLERLYLGLQKRGIPEEKIPIVLSYILEESGGDPKRSDKYGRGLMDGIDFEDNMFIDDDDSLIESQLDAISDGVSSGRIDTDIDVGSTMYGDLLQYGYGKMYAEGGLMIPDDEELARRQAWAESLFNSKARSPRGAMGIFQIMPNTLAEYQTSTGDKGDIYDDAYNRKVRDWLMDRLGKSRTIYNGDPSDEVRLAKLYAAYNWGQGNLGNYLQKQKDAGVDIYQTLDWVGGLPEETRNYVNFIIGGKDTGAHRTNDLYGKAIKTFAPGGQLWDPDKVLTYPESDVASRAADRRNASTEEYNRKRAELISRYSGGVKEARDAVYIPMRLTRLLRTWYGNKMPKSVRNGEVSPKVYMDTRPLGIANYSGTVMPHSNTLTEVRSALQANGVTRTSKDDFVSAFFDNGTPLKEWGVEEAPESDYDIFRQALGTNYPEVVGGDTIRAYNVGPEMLDIVPELNSLVNQGKADIRSVDPVPSAWKIYKTNNTAYDANDHTLITVDYNGNKYHKRLDVFDVKGQNDPNHPVVKEVADYLTKYGKPYVVATPWVLAK